MNSVMTYLATLKGCNTEYLTTTLKYVQHLPIDLDSVNDRILQTTGVDISGMDMVVEQRQYLFLYIIQTGWQAASRQETMDDEEIFKRALDANDKFFSQQFVRMAIMAETTERRQKMSKGELAYEIYCDNVSKISRNDMIVLLAEELDTSKSGATTYYYNAKKKHGDV